MSNAFPPWSSTATYPAGGGFPWSGALTKGAPAYTFFTPGQTPSAQELNYLLNQRDGALALAAGNSAADAAANWNAPATSIKSAAGVNVGFYGVAWDFAFSKFVAVGWEGTTPNVNLYESVDGRAWRLIPIIAVIQNQTLTKPYGLGVYPLTGTIVYYVTNNTGTAGSMIQMTQGSAPTGATFSQAWATRGGATMKPCNLVYFYGATTPGMYVFGTSLFQSSGAWTGFAAFDNSDGAGNPWTDLHTSLPASFQSGNGGVCKIETAQSPTKLLVAICGTTPGTDTSFLCAVAQNGTMSDVTPSFIGVNQNIRGLAYSYVDGLFGMVTTDNSNQSWFYYSSDGITWSQPANLNPIGGAPLGLACIRSTWVILKLSSFVTQNEYDEVFFFSDLVAANTLNRIPAVRKAAYQAAISTQPNFHLLLSSDEYGNQILPVAFPAGTTGNTRVLCDALIYVAGLSGNTQSLRSGGVDFQQSAAAIPAPLPGWNTAFDQDFSKLSTATFGVDGPISLGSFTWTKVRSANDRSALAINNGTGLVFSPTANMTGGGVFLPLNAIIPASALLWSTAFRIWVFIQNQNLSNNGDSFRCGFVQSSSSVSQQPGGRIGVNGTGPFVEADFSPTGGQVQQLTAGGFSTKTNTMIVETPSLDSAVSRYLAGQYSGGAWPAEGSGMPYVATIDSGSISFQDPSAVSPSFPNGLGLAIWPTAPAASAALTITIGRVRVDYKL